MMMRRTRLAMPFIVSISGVDKIGVSVACQRLSLCTTYHTASKFVEMKNRNVSCQFEDDLLTDEYKDLRQY